MVLNYRRPSNLGNLKLGHIMHLGKSVQAGKEIIHILTV